jgi:exonuclease SbcC
VARHRSVVASTERHLQALQRLAAAGTALRDASEAAEAALAEHGFGDAQRARAAALPVAEVRRLESACEDYTRARTQAETVLADPEVQTAAEAAAPDLDDLRSSAEAAHTALLHAKDCETLARRTLSAVVRLRADLTERCQAMGPAAEQHALVRDLADTFAGTGGNNALRMRLSSFVLAARLEKVAELANERLAVMGEGRYRLQHSDGLAARGARSGLGLRVLDLWTGQVRDTSTLSGGEAFMASLALALGLADAVREESGGFDLQTLFVDEGFGTLDDESLEQVMTVLDGLRDGGRCVGVVSHVSDLRSRVPAQVRVDKTSTGSSVTVLGIDSPAA